MDIGYGLVLTGGGLRGSYQVGVYKALKELNIKIDGVVGVSVGAINGAFILQDDIELMENLYKNLKIEQIMSLSKKSKNKDNVFSITNWINVFHDYRQNKGLENIPLRENIIKYLDVNKVYDSKKDFGLVAYSVKTREPLIKCKEEIPKEKLVDYLLASSCLPVFKAQVIDEKEYYDGGFYDRSPINILLNKGYKNIIVVDITGAGFNRKLIDTDIYLKIISSNEKLGGVMETNSDIINKNLKLGYLDAMKSFNKLQGHIYYFKKEEFSKMLELFNLQTICGLEFAAQIYNIDKYREYEFEEFINTLKFKHKRALGKYNQFKNKLKAKKIFQLPIKVIFEKGFGLCYMIDKYLSRPNLKKYRNGNDYRKDAIEAVKAMVELMNNYD